MNEEMKKAIEIRKQELEKMDLKIEATVVEMSCSGRADGSWR